MKKARIFLAFFCFHPFASNLSPLILLIQESLDTLLRCFLERFLLHLYIVYARVGRQEVVEFLQVVFHHALYLCE